MEEKSQSAHWRSTRCCECGSQRTIQKKPLRAGGRVGHSQDTLPNPSVCLHFHLSVCESVLLFVCLPLPHSVGGLFQLKAEEGKPPPVRLHPHPSLIQFALICREPHLSLRAGGRWDGGGEPAHCLCMNQGHWKIKADCGEIITDCSCGIILMRLGLTKPCLLYTTASLWDDYC